MKRKLWLLGLLLAVMPALAYAQAEAVNSGDTAWILTSTALVLMMTLPGLSLFYAGMVRQANVLSIFMQCFVIACVITIVWVVIGYSLAFGDSGLSIGGSSLIGNLDNFLMGEIKEETVSGSIPTSVFAMFQLTFAIITPALVVGGFAERMRFKSMLLFSVLWSLLVYIPITHWVWGGGWLGDRGFLDFAGGSVVHITAGVAAIVSAIYIGTRKGFPQAMNIPHNLPFCAVGAGLLWVGWFGFNGGSALAASGDAAMALAATHISAAMGAFTWMCAEWIKYGKPTVLGALTGMVAGLGTITPASGFVGPAGALVIGLAAGYICFEATSLIKRKLKIDDSLDVFSVHGVGGFLGCILTGVFASASLSVFSGQESINILGQVGTQALGAISAVVWTAVVTLIILFVVDKLLGLRVSETEEAEGLDLEEHNERGYSW